MAPSGLDACLHNRTTRLMTASAPHCIENLALTGTHSVMQDLRLHSALHYWSDLLLCTTAFWTMLWLCCWSSQWFFFVLLAGSFVLYRMALFTHEICHFKAGVLPGFELAWNVICGIPSMMPSFMLKTHIDHHLNRSYGTFNDPEYLPFATYP